MWSVRLPGGYGNEMTHTTRALQATGMLNVSLDLDFRENGRISEYKEISVYIIIAGEKCIK